MQFKELLKIKTILVENSFFFSFFIFFSPTNVKQFYFGIQPFPVVCLGSSTTAGVSLSQLPSAGSQVANLQQETRFPLSVGMQERRDIYLFIYCPARGQVRGNVHILNVCISAGPEHKFALAEETVAKIRLYFFFLISEVQHDFVYMF